MKNKSGIYFLFFLVKWFIILAIGVAFLPISVGLLFCWLIYKKVENITPKIALIVLIAIPTFILGAGWVNGMINPSKVSPASEITNSVKLVPDSTSKTKEQNQIGFDEMTPSPNPTTTSSPTPTLSPTLSPKPTLTPPTPKPTFYQPTLAPIIYGPTLAPVVNTDRVYFCNCSKTCTQISSCAEAQYLLNTCGCSARDADHDGIACDSAPLHCQN